MARAGPAVVLCWLLTAACAAEPIVECRPDGATLSNATIRAEFSLDERHWRLAKLSRADGSAELPLDADPIAVLIYEGAELTAESFRPQEPPRPDGPGALTVRLTCPEAELTAELRYWLVDDDPYLRKTIALSGGDAIIDELRLLSTRTVADLRGGGRGLPVYVGDAWWFGAEYPSYYGEVSEDGFVLRHYPGKTADGSWSSKTMVCGVAPEGLALELAFADYVAAIKRPSRSFLQYNSWYDWRGDQMTVENFHATATAYREHLLEPYGLHMDAYVPDDGWQNPQSVWRPREDIYPDGLGPMAEMFESEGSRMGLWLSLFGVKLDIGWAEARGYEVNHNKTAYCLAGERSFSAMRQAVERLIDECNLVYYKHDFNVLNCSAEGHGHLPTSRHGHEANLDAELELLARERASQPGIFLNVTSGMWLSPWWLQYADTIWMAASDFGFERTFPQLSRREWALSYRDAHFHRVYLQEHNPTPLSALMTHGVIKGKRNRIGGPHETLREWSDYVALLYGRGVLLKEMYVSPELMNEEQWRVLGTATRWATENWRDLEPTRMIGGDPRQGQPYGFAHWLGEHGIIALRNPHYQAQTMRLALDQTEGCRAEPGAGFAAREIYPAHRPLPDELTAGGRNEVTLAPCSVTVIELRPQANWPTSAPTAAVVPPELSGLVAPASLTGDHRGEHIVAVSLPAVDVPHQRLDLYLIIRGPGANHVPVSARINGAEAQPRPAEGPGWLIRSWDLRPLLGQPIDCTARLGGLGDRPFMNPSVEVEAWLVGEAGERSESDPFAGEHLPWAIAQGCTAYSTPLLPAAAVARTDLPTITADDLAGIRAAKLRLEVFGANPQPQYAGKQILINGAAVAELPANTGTLDAWQEKIIDLPAEHLGLLRLDNTLMLTNVGGDSYKARGLALAVQRADGIWVTTDFSDRVLCSAQGWLHAEGELFEGDRSAEVELTLP